MLEGLREVSTPAARSVARGKASGFVSCRDVAVDLSHPAWRQSGPGKRQRLARLLTGNLARATARSAGDLLLVASVAGGLVLAAIGCR